MLFELKYCSPDLQCDWLPLRHTVETKRSSLLCKLFYKDNNCHCATRWLELSVQNTFKSTWFCGFLKKWRQDAEGFCMDQWRVIAPISDCNSHRKIVGYAKGVSQLSVNVKQQMVQTVKINLAFQKPESPWHLFFFLLTKSMQIQEKRWWHL